MSRKEDILTALQSLKDEDLRTAGAALFDALGYRSTRTFEDLPTDPTSFWDFFSQGHSDLDPGKAEIEHWRGATFLFQLTDAEVHDLAKAREATKEQGDYEESEIESFLFLAIDLVGEQWTRTRLAQITRTLNRLFLMPAIVLFRHGGLASLAVIDRRQSKVDAAKDVILAKKIAIVKDIRLAKPHRAHIDILEKLTFANLNRGRNITTFRALYDAWLAACSVETLTKEFFTKLSELFFDTSDSVATRFPDENERRLFVQTLFNRLIFLRFVEEKGWMKIDGRYDYLQALWEKARDSNQPLWPTRLNALFGAVNHPISDKVHEVAKPIIGTVPYLNGGLFEDDSRFADPTVQFPDVIFDRLVGAEGLLYRYLFTVEESTPLDVQVAVDPEILGKIFEQLTISSKRHDTGSYYTPREIVQFMCREALVGYLGSKGIAEDKARKLVYEHDTSPLTEAEGRRAWDALFAIKVVDPACGSGAYLLGMLQELYALTQLLDRPDPRLGDDPKTREHKRKLWIIENNIYGVDLQAFATNTAMLRLWLTLLVEDTGARPQPLPNLEYKIETGDSLLGPDPSQPIDWSKAQRGLDFEAVEETVDALRKLRSKYQDSHGEDKKAIKAKLDGKLEELREKVTGSPKKDPAKFDWRVEFFDVFLEDPKQRQPGFDAALANPPYVRQELIKDQKPALKAAFGEFFCGTADLYTYFYARAVHLLSPGGMLAFISSNKWFRAAYGEKLRAFMAKETAIRSITDFGELPVFSAATYPMIFVAQKNGAGQGGRPNAQTNPPGGGMNPPSGGMNPPGGGTNPPGGGMSPPGAGTNPPGGGTSPSGGGTSPSGGGMNPPGGGMSPPGGGMGGGTLFTQVKSLAPPYPDVKALIEHGGFVLPADAIQGSKWTLADKDTLARLRKMEASGIPLGEYAKGKIYRGILTGLNQVKIGSDRKMYGKSLPRGVSVVSREGVFVIDSTKRAELIAEDTRSGEIIRPLAVGKDIRRWTVEDNDRWVIVTKIGTDMGRYPAVMRHLERFKNLLVPRADQGEHWWELRACAYYAEFTGPKIVFPDMSQNARFAIAGPGVMLTNTAYFVPGGDLFLLAVLNSRVFASQLAELLNENLSGTQRAFTERMVHAPIPRASDVDRDAIAALVQKCLDAKAADPNADVSCWEAEIDAIVERLYFGEKPS